MTALVSVRRLGVRLPDGARLLEDVSFDLGPGEALAIVGRSGAGKTTLVHALCGLVPSGAALEGSLLVDGEELAGAPPDRWRRVRGRRIGLLPQEPLGALDPVRTVGAQLVETLRAHHPLGRRAARERARMTLDELGVAHAAGRLRAHAFELSGGERQRVALALALAGDPSLLVADEPTSALDRLLAREVVGLLEGLRARRGLALVVVTHDLELAAALRGPVLVIDGGRVVERTTAELLARAPASAPAQRLVGARVRLGREVVPC